MQHRRIKEIEAEKIREMKESYEQERIAEEKARHPFAGTKYPAGYKSYIPTPIPKKQPDVGEDFKAALRESIDKREPHESFSYVRFK